MSIDSKFRVVVAGRGVQGEKRLSVAGPDVVATVDPRRSDVDFSTLVEVPLESYDATLLCIPDESKYELIEYLIANGKHALMEKPLLVTSAQFDRLLSIQEETQASVYVAYNHRFEPHVASLREALREGRLGHPYSVTLSYGNGTAALVRQSEWRDEGLGVIPDLASHLLDMVDFWWGLEGREISVIDARRFENRAYDYALLRLSGEPVVYLETSMVSWRNHFRADVQASNGSAHISSLCKWGPSSLTIRDRKLPSGRPDESVMTLVMPDPTWQAEYLAFKELVASGSLGNLSTSRRIARLLHDVAQQLEGK